MEEVEPTEKSEDKVVVDLKEAEKTSIDLPNWSLTREEVRKALAQIEVIHEASKVLLVNTSHLTKLDNVAEALTQVALHVGEMKTTLLEAATGGRERFIYKIIGGVLVVLVTVISGLLIVIGTLLIGEKFGVIRHLWEATGT